jgi:glycosyltransferase involved in cell wall biosynthesis
LFTAVALSHAAMCGSSVTEYLPVRYQLACMTAPEPAPAVPAVPAVSVVVPCYNGGVFLDRLLGSLSAQSFRDFEIIIVDDGSNEETRAKLASLDPAIRVFRQSNLGPAAARNTGFRHARAPLVFTLDCDDTIEPQTLELLSGLLKDAPETVALAFSDIRMEGASETVISRSFNAFDLLFSNTVLSGLMIRKSVWQAVGGYDETMRDGYEDWEFPLRIALAGYRGVGVKQTLYHYRVRPGGLLFSRSTALHSRLWRTIREKHADTYRLPAMIRLWWNTRDGTGRVPLMRGLCQYAAACLLPDAWFNGVIGALRRRRLLGVGGRGAGA